MPEKQQSTIREHISNDNTNAYGPPFGTNNSYGSAHHSKKLDPQQTTSKHTKYKTAKKPPTIKAE